jgi:predicted transposase YdaD
MKEVRNMLQTRVEQWIEQWKQEGRLEGEQRGEQRGEAALLLRLLQRRFGVLPGWATELVRSADSVAMEEWGIRLLDAATLEEVLAGR